ncbi:RsbRD N-terminal domain-containing protein [Thermodesulfovibrio sp. Kuro-1]|uniref:RsbRD N-terminal domain-containing protein n=1 Tax=Thermodesulfovibrio sp. Kuro-1 TaxID=2580394 RepID=UPI0011416A24|nr:RsbRD N-terminal domain-containing protein [Thermodesulfovibrio sp. Kuro-1]
MPIKDLLSKKRKAIVNKSFELTIATYPEESQGFLKDSSRQFTNPIGYNLYQSIEQIVEKIINEEPIESFLSPLEEIIKIRAVQDFTPSQAVGFIFLIKKAFQDELEKEIEPFQILDFLSRIDSLSLIAFDIFMKYREKIYDLKSKELIDRTWWILKKWNIVSEIPDKTVQTK